MTKKQQRLHALLSEAYETHAKSLRKHAIFKLNNIPLADDLVQETFFKAWKYLLRQGEIEMMHAFLYHVLDGLIIDQYRKAKRKVVSLDVLLESGYEPCAIDYEREYNVFDGKEAFQLTKQLSSHYQEVLTMRYMKGLSLGEMAEITGQSKNTMAVQTHRGLGKLRELYFARFTTA